MSDKTEIDLRIIYLTKMCSKAVFRIHKCLGLPDPLVRGTDADSGPSIIKQK